MIIETSFHFRLILVSRTNEWLLHTRASLFQEKQSIKLACIVLAVCSVLLTMHAQLVFDCFHFEEKKELFHKSKYELFLLHEHGAFAFAHFYSLHLQKKVLFTTSYTIPLSKTKPAIPYEVSRLKFNIVFSLLSNIFSIIMVHLVASLVCRFFRKCFCAYASFLLCVKEMCRGFYWFFSFSPVVIYISLKGFPLRHSIISNPDNRSQLTF